jgi:hypothetical protein
VECVGHSKVLTFLYVKKKLWSWACLRATIWGYVWLYLWTEKPVEADLNRFFVGPHKSKIVMDQRPECSCGLDGPSFYRSCSLASPRTEPVNTVESELRCGG